MRWFKKRNSDKRQYICSFLVPWYAIPNYPFYCADGDGEFVSLSMSTEGREPSYYITLRKKTIPVTYIWVNKYLPSTEGEAWGKILEARL